MAALVLLAAFLVVSIVRIARRPAEPEPTPEATQTPETVVITPEPTPTPEVVKPASFAFPYEVKEYAAEPDNTSGYKTSWGTEVREGYVTPTFGYNEISIDTGGEVSVWNPVRYTGTAFRSSTAQRSRSASTPTVP